MNGKVAALNGPSSFEWQTYPIPRPAPGALVLKVRRANICGSDIHAFHGESPALSRAVPGHEFVGEILSLGEGVTTDNAGVPVAIGDRVVPVYYLTCRHCKACLRGDFNMCQNSLVEWAKPPSESPHFRGGFATHYYVSPDQYFFKVPNSISDDIVAGANCGLSQMIFAINSVNVTAGQTVVIQGAGGVGLYAVAVAKDRGARVIVIEAVPDRIALAKSFGADEVIDMAIYTTAEARVDRALELTENEGPDFVIELTGVSHAFGEALLLSRVGGTIVSVGNLNVGARNEISIAPGLVTRKNLTVRGILRYNPGVLHEALLFLERTSGTFPFHELASREYSLENLADALADSESRTVARASVVMK